MVEQSSTKRKLLTIETKKSLAVHRQIAV